MSSLLYEKEMEDMSSILEQTGEGLDSQIEVFTSLLNYLTYSPDIEDLITEKNMDNYYAYKKYTEVADPLRFLRAREVVHFQRFGEALRVVQENLDAKNFYIMNPEFDTGIKGKCCEKNG